MAVSVALWLPVAKLLLVEDDLDLLVSLQDFFTLNGYVVEPCETGEDALQLLASFQYDVIIMDWGLPQMNGDEVCRTFRRQGGQTPIVFLTGRDDLDYLEAAFDAGADDYVKKPAEVRELLARVKGLLKRRTGTFVPALKIGGLELKPEKNALLKGAVEIQLRAKETALLEYLMRHPNKIFSAQQLLDAIWAADGEGSTDSVRTWMNLLRRKLALVSEESLIKTVVGSGYIIETRDGIG